MTYGEAAVASKEICHISKGLYVATLPTHAPKMTKQEAVIYYNKKLEKYWIKNLSDSIPKHKEKDALMYLLGRKNRV